MCRDWGRGKEKSREAKGEREGGREGGTTDIETRRERVEEPGHGEQRLQRFIGQRYLMGTMPVPHFLHNLENGAATSTDATEYI